MDIVTLAIAKKYVDNSLAGAGAVAGKPCQIQSITEITGGHRITFLWVDNDNVSHTSTMDVMNGDKGETGETGATGKGVKSVAINPSNHLIVTYTDNTTADAGVIDVSSKADKVVSAVAGNLASLTADGDLADSGITPALEATMTTIYVDNANGDDANDGLTDTTPIKTINSVTINKKYTLTKGLRIKLLSDYVGDVTIMDYPAVIMTTNNGNNQQPDPTNCKITGKVKFGNVAEAFIQAVNIEAQSELCRFENCGFAYIGASILTYKSDATSNGRCILFYRCGCATATKLLLKNLSNKTVYGLTNQASAVYVYMTLEMQNITYGFDFQSNIAGSYYLSRDIFFNCGANKLTATNAAGQIFLDGDIYKMDRTYTYEGQELNLVKKPTFGTTVINSGAFPIPSGYGSLQGGNAYNGKWIQLFDAGTFAIYDLANKLATVEAYGQLGSYDPDLNHANDLTFGNKYNDADDFPLLYLSGYADSGGVPSTVCHVERLVSDGQGGYTASNIQNIYIDMSGFSAKGYTEVYGHFNVLCDVENGYLYTFGAKWRTNGEESAHDNENRYYITRFALPDTSQASVTLDADDVKVQFTLPYDIDFTQGATIWNSMLFHLFGDGSNTTHPNGIRVYDLTKGVEITKIDCSQVAWKIREPEDIAVYNGAMYVVVQNKYLWRIDV